MLNLLSKVSENKMKHAVSRYQHYALNASNEIVHIDDAENGCVFKCLHCGGEMITKKGKVRQWHFAHKTLTDNCCYETYLHSLAKIKIRDCFYRGEKFDVEFLTKEVCIKRNQCIWFDNETACDCESDGLQRFDLKRYYDACDMEVSYRNFRADLFLYDTANTTRPPVFIEICVKHPCTEDKINSGIRIIELLIKTEADIESVIESSFLRECDNVRFYNFNRKTIAVDSPRHRKLLSKFILDRNLKYFRNYTDCKSYTQRQSNAIFEVTIKLSNCFLKYSFSQMGLMTAYKCNYKIRNCCLCKYHECHDDMSHLKPILCKLGTSKYCEYTRAESCSAFCIDKTLYNDISEYIEKWDVWRNDDV